MNISTLISSIIVLGTIIGFAVNFPKFMERVRRVRKDPRPLQILSLAANVVVVAALFIAAIAISRVTITINGQSALGANSTATAQALIPIPTNTRFPAPGSTVAPTATPPPPGTILYQTTDFNGWFLNGSWKHLNGQLVYAGTSAGALLSPLQTSSRNYTITIKVMKPSAMNIVGLFARQGQTRSTIYGYQADLGSCADIVAIGVATVSQSCAHPFPAGSDWHIVAFSLKDNALSASIDGQVVAAGSDNRLPIPGNIGIFTDGPITIESFTVVQL